MPTRDGYCRRTTRLGDRRQSERGALRSRLVGWPLAAGVPCSRRRGGNGPSLARSRARRSAAARGRARQRRAARSPRPTGSHGPAHHHRSRRRWPRPLGPGPARSWRGGGRVAVLPARTSADAGRRSATAVSVATGSGRLDADQQRSGGAPGRRLAARYATHCTRVRAASADHRGRPRCRLDDGAHTRGR